MFDSLYLIFTYFNLLVVRCFATMYMFVGIASFSTGNWRHNVIVTRTIWEVSLADVSRDDTGRSLLCYKGRASAVSLHCQEAQWQWRHLAIVGHLQQCWTYICERRILVVHQLLQQKKARRGSICCMYVCMYVCMSVSKRCSTLSDA